MEFTGWVLLVVLLVAAAAVGLLAWWRVRVVREGGVEVAMRIRPDLATSRWHVGVGCYRGDEFVWYRATALLSRPNVVVARAGLIVVQRRKPTGSEVYAMPRGATVLRCQAGRIEFELAMNADALTGFLSWLEAAPPGRTVPWAS